MSRKQEIENYLTNGSEKYWTLMKGGSIKRNTGVVYKNNYTYINYHVSDFKETGIRFISRNFEKPIWEIRGDTLIKSNHFKYKIEYINEDILVLNYIREKNSDSQIVVYYKSKDQETKPIVDTANINFPYL